MTFKIVGTSFLVVLLLAGNGISVEAVSFNRDVRPILASTCFRCHGLDPKSREAELRLDLFETATMPLASGRPAITPGSLANSALWDRIQSIDPDTVMPPPSSQHQLSDEQKVVLKTWIEQGAAYQKHWSFEPITSPGVPTVDGNSADWVSAPIDHFIANEHKQVGLTPNALANKQILIRRVAFTLTGLPPTIEELALFEGDQSDQSYNRMVQRYLDSPRFGEEMARHWLDVARYGDTHGLHLDNVRNIWAYRDWVVDAFNRNLPFDEFTIEQLAGDLLPSPSTSQLVATGFQRCNVTTSEGGAINDEFLFRYAVDRASTTAQAWLGLTGGCAVCHDHKFDPLSTREFYSMYAFFYSNEDPAMDGNIASTSPIIELIQPAQQDQLTELNRQIQATKSSLESLVAARMDSGDLEPVADESGQNSFVEILLDDDFPPGSSQSNTSRNPPEWFDASQLEPARGQRSLYQSFGNQFQQSISNGISNPIVPKDPVLSFSLRIDRWQPPTSVFIELVTNQGSKRWEWKAGVDKAGVDKAGANSTDSPQKTLPEPNAWKTIEVKGEDFGLAPGAEISELKVGQFGGTIWWDAIELRGSAPAENDNRTDWERWWNSRKGKDTATASGELNTVLKGGRTESDTEEAIRTVKQFYYAWVSRTPRSDVQSQRELFDRLAIDTKILRAHVGDTLIYRDLAQPRQAFVMERGQYDKQGQEVQPGVPDIFPPLVLQDPTKKANRMDLARWLVDDRNPLVARVTVNRFWQQVFGTGLVKTSDDFGTQGSLPSHPELLDYLANEFRTNGWNTKELMRALVSTATFRQSSIVSNEALRIDPENRFLARGPRIRLDAEQLRDNALAVGGLLSSKMGGPGVKTYQPTNIWEPVGYGDSNTRYYIQDHGDSLYRRSLYCFIKRTAPPPFMSNFDAPNREQFCTRRERSNTPLQALQLMNDIQHVEAARKFAERILQQTEATPAERIRFAFRSLLARDPNPEETSMVLENLERFERGFVGRASDAIALSAIGESMRDESLDVRELAAYTLLANMLMNLDETINRN